MAEELVREDDILPGCSTFDDFIQAAYPMMMKSIRVSNSLPKSQQFGYYKTYSEFEKIMDTQSIRLQDTMHMVLQHVGTKRKIHNQAESEKFELIVDANDKLLDRAHKSMTFIDGTRFNPDDDFGEKSATKKVSAVVAPVVKRPDVVKLTVQQKIIRPQVMFKDKIDNSNKPWEPIIKEKPNAIKPLSILSTVNENNQETYTHPYEFELDMLKPKDDRLVRFENIKNAKAIEETPLVYVETEKDLEGLLEDLKPQKEIGVDLEHHSFRSFMGFTCLMQISTIEKDYIIDTLALRHKLYILNDVFTDPKILKIFHGAQSDIEWLQRDFGLYIVHMFDTFEAAKVLDYQKLGLAHLLKRFCQVEANKQFQLYDWRTRPLPEKARFYARQDTHYLIYIYQMMSNELFDKSEGPRSLEVVFNHSRDVCKRVYMKPLLDENSHMTLYRRMQRPFDTRQLFALKEIYKWRDGIARVEDESPGYVLSNHMMMQIAQTLPREVQGILACCNPIPPLVRQHALTLHSIILKAKEVPLVKTFPNAKTEDFSTRRNLEMETRLSYFTHDNAGIETREGLPTVLNGRIKNRGEPPKVKPQLAILADKNEETISEMMKITFISPYQRYLNVLPYSIQQEKQEIELQKKKDAKEAEEQNKKQNLDGKQPEPKADRFAGELPSAKSEQKSEKKIKTEANVVDDLSAKVKEEVEEDRKRRKNKKFTPRKKLKGQEPPQDFTPYDYKSVDFNRFHSQNQPNRISLPNNKKNKQVKRKQQFQGKSQPKKRKGQWW